MKKIKKIKKHRPIRWDKLFDWWSVPHFMFGMVMVLISITFSLPTAYTFFATLYLALFWELLEKRFRLSEAPGNGGMDVILPLLAFWVTYFMVNKAALNHEGHVGLLTVVSLVYGFVNMIAWRARFEQDASFRG